MKILICFMIIFFYVSPVMANEQKSESNPISMPESLFKIMDVSSYGKTQEKESECKQ